MCLSSITVDNFSPLVLLHFPYCYYRMLFMQLIKFRDGEKKLGIYNLQWLLRLLLLLAKPMPLLFPVLDLNLPGSLRRWEWNGDQGVSYLGSWSQRTVNTAECTFRALMLQDYGICKCLETPSLPDSLGSRTAECSRAPVDFTPR